MFRIDFLFYYVNLIRAVLASITVVQLFKRNYTKITPTAIVIALSFLPWLLSLMHIPINAITEFLFPTVVLMAVYLGFGCKYYDTYPWWDQVVHFLSGILFFSFGISLAGMERDVSLAGMLIFSFAVSLASHEIWEVIEFLNRQHFSHRSSALAKAKPRR